MSEYLLGFRASVLQYQAEKMATEAEKKKKEEQDGKATPTVPTRRV